GPGRSGTGDSVTSLSPPEHPADVLIDPRLCDIFVEEAAELFDRLQTLVLELGTGPGDDAERVAEIKRCLHTLKGASLSVGLASLGTTVHLAEESFEEAGDQIGMSLTRRLEDVLSEIESTLTALRAGTTTAAKPASLTPDASAPPDQEARERLVAEGPGTTGRDAPGPAEARATSDGDGTLRVPAVSVDELMDLVSE